MVSGLGLEPRMTGPKPVVIPFHHPELKSLAVFTVFPATAVVHRTKALSGA